MNQDFPPVSSGKSAIVTLATAWPEDEEFLAALRQSWIAQYADYIGTSAAQSLVKQLRDAGELYPSVDQSVQLAMIGGMPVGVAASRSLQGLTLITMLEVLPVYRRHGVGGRLLGGLLENTAQRLLAHVSIHRPQVLGFYENQGFRQLPRTRVDHYGHDLEFDVMVK